MYNVFLYYNLIVYNVHKIMHSKYMVLLSDIKNNNDTRKFKKKKLLISNT